MQVSEKTLIDTRRLVNHPANPRKITNEALNRLCDSIRQNGYWPHRPAAVEPVGDGSDKFYVLDGNQRLKALRRMKRREMPCVIYTDLTDAERDEIILRSNINNGEWVPEMLQVEFADHIDLGSIGLEIELPEITVGDIGGDLTTGGGGNENENESEKDPDSPDPEEEAQAADRMAFWYRMMGDYLYPSDNEFDIPVLLTDNQPVHLELPFTPWGVEGRYKKGITTYHFYVEDYRFEQLYKNPILLLQSGCRAVVEPNNSIHDQTPTAYAIYQIYRKRYLARYLQECGLQVWVDLNVSPHFEEINALGVPEGYNAFFTRGVSGWQPTLERHLQMAQRISGREHPNLCVYGGGKDIEEWCRERSLRWTPEYMNESMKKKGLKK